MVSVTVLKPPPDLGRNHPVWSDKSPPVPIFECHQILDFVTLHPRYQPSNVVRTRYGARSKSFSRAGNFLVPNVYPLDLQGISFDRMIWLPPRVVLGG